MRKTPHAPTRGNWVPPVIDMQDQGGKKSTWAYIREVTFFHVVVVFLMYNVHFRLHLGKIWSPEYVSMRRLSGSTTVRTCGLHWTRTFPRKRRPTSPSIPRQIFLICQGVWKIGLSNMLKGSVDPDRRLWWFGVLPEQVKLNGLDLWVSFFMFWLSFCHFNNHFRSSYLLQLNVFIGKLRRRG